MTHRNEFPADYSLAGCSPAEPASASSAVPILNQKTLVCEHFAANGNCSPNPLSHFTAQSNVPTVLSRVPGLFPVQRGRQRLFPVFYEPRLLQE